MPRRCGSVLFTLAILCWSSWLKEIIKDIVPFTLRRRLRSWQQGMSVRPRRGTVRFGSLNGVKPISSTFGFDRGSCIDRYYIEKFLQQHSRDIRGHVLEVADNEYTRRFGSGVVQSTVLHAKAGNPNATLVGDLSTGENIPTESFDCIILTQTMQFIYETRSAVANLYRALKFGGVVLATFPGISQISRYDRERWGDFWRFTTESAQRLFMEQFRPEDVTVCAHGNVFAAVSFLHGLSVEDVSKSKLDYADPDYELVITVRAIKGSQK